MDKYCMNCGAENLENANFCIKCGTKIEIQKTTGAPQQQPTQTVPQTLGEQLFITCHSDWTDDMIWESVKAFCSAYTTKIQMQELEPNVLFVSRDFGALAGVYKAMIRINNDSSGSKYVIVDYERGAWKRKAYVKIFWTNLHQGLNQIFSQPISGISE